MRRPILVVTLILAAAPAGGGLAAPPQDEPALSETDCAGYQALVTRFDHGLLQWNLFIPPRDPALARPAAIDPVSFNATLEAAQAGGHLTCAPRRPGGRLARVVANPRGASNAYSRIAWNPDRTAGLVFVATDRGVIIRGAGSARSKAWGPNYSYYVQVCGLKRTGETVEVTGCAPWIR